MQKTYEPSQRIPMSWEEYEALGEFRGEYIDGQLVVLPLATRTHQQIVIKLTTVIDTKLPEGYEAIHQWGWMPDRDDFIPDVMVFDATEEQQRLTTVPHLAVEVLSTDLAIDILRKLAKYAAAGLERFWIVDDEGPEVVVHRIEDGVLVERSRHGPGERATLDVGPLEVTFDPADLAR